MDKNESGGDSTREQQQMCSGKYICSFKWFTTIRCYARAHWPECGFYLKIEQTLKKKAVHWEDFVARTTENSKINILERTHTHNKLNI